MSQSTPDVTELDDRIVVEAPTAEAALEAVTERFGTRARIAKVEQVRRGGVAGFFARELVQVVALPEPDATTPPDLRVPVAVAVDPAAGAAPAPAEPGAAGDGADGDAFADLLRAHLSPRTTAAGAAARAPRPVGDDARPAPDADPAGAGASAAGPGVGAAVAPAGPAVAGGGRAADDRRDERSGAPRAAHVGLRSATPAVHVPGTPYWTVDNLCRLGLPPQLLDAVAEVDPADDAGWTHALARRLAPLCGRVPPQDDLIVGPAALELATAFDLPVRWPGEPVPSGTFVAPVTDDPAGRAWLGAVRGRRRLHLVVGGAGWRGLLFERPAMLSSVDAAGLCETLRLAIELDLALGVLPLSHDRLGRPDPVGLAITIRGLLPVADRW